MIITLAGPIGSGKSSLARSVAAALGAPSAGFGDYVRARATEAGLDAGSRRVLQDLGHDLVEADARGFLDAALDWSGHQAGRDLVLDGLRHMAILDALRAREAESLDTLFLLYLDTPVEVRQARIAARGVSLADMQTAEAHPAERDLNEHLRAAADVILPGDAPLSALTEAAFAALASRRD